MDSKIDVGASHRLYLPYRHYFKVVNAKHCDTLFMDWIKGKEARLKEARLRGEPQTGVRYIPDVRMDTIEVSGDSPIYVNEFIRFLKARGQIKRELPWHMHPGFRKMKEHMRHGTE